MSNTLVNTEVELELLRYTLGICGAVLLWTFRWARRVYKDFQETKASVDRVQKGLLKIFARERELTQIVRRMGYQIETPKNSEEMEHIKLILNYLRDTSYRNPEFHKARLLRDTGEAVSPMLEDLKIDLDE